jgi:mono/diheme cytochrome c family protein
MRLHVAAPLIALGLLAGCGDGGPSEPAQPSLDGRQIFRFDTFGDETFWTDTLRMHEVIQQAVDPATALAVGLKVDVDALPPGLLESADLHDPATTVALLKLNAVVGVQGKVETVNGRDTLTQVGITCALCHSSVDNSVQPGIGHRLDGWPNHELNPGAIIALSPALTAEQKAVYNSWGPGRYDPRFNRDGINAPVPIPPAYGLAGVSLATATGDGDISYWNAYVAITQMHGHGTFVDPRIGADIHQTPDLVTPKLPALKDYQVSLPAPPPPAGSFDAAAAARGETVFNGPARCATCHAPPTFTDDRLYDPAAVGADPGYADRSATRTYRTTPLRALWEHAPYFHDGSAATLSDVVAHYESVMGLQLTPEQRQDLVEYLKSL